VSLVILLVVFVFTTTLIHPSSFHWQNSFFAITVVCIAIMSGQLIHSLQYNATDVMLFT
jgi:uncharacterized integral membrane protein